MKKTYERYRKAFKLEAVRLVEESNESVRQVARDLNVRPSQLYKWRKELSEKSGEAFPGKGKVSDKEAELRQLKAEDARLKEEAEILKKAAAYFAKESG